MRLQLKMSLSVIAAVVAVFSALGCLSYATSRRIVEAQIENGAKNFLTEQLLKLDGQSNQVENAVNGITTALETLTHSSDEQVKNLIKTTLSSYPQIYGSTVSFQPGTFDDTHYLFGPYFSRGANGFEYKDLSDTSYYYPKWEWYTVPLATGKPAWSEPYFDVGGGNIAMTTYSKPFFKDGAGWGVATADVALTDLTAFVRSIKVGETGFAFLISREGKFLSIKEESWHLKRTIGDVAKEMGDPVVAAVGDKMIAGETGFVALSNIFGSEEVWVMFGPDPQTRWSLGIVYPKDELMGELESLHFRLFALAFGGILLVTAIVIIIARHISRPIRELAAGAENIAKGDFTTKIKGSSSGDEVGSLSRALDKMQKSLVATLGNLTEEKKLFESVFTHITDGLLVLDSDNMLVEFNKTAGRLLMLPPEDKIAEHLEKNFESSLPFTAAFAPSEEVKQFKMSRRVSGDSSPLHLMAVVSPLKTSEGEHRGILMYVRDITSEETQDISKRDFLSLMSHKLLTPVTVMEGKVMLFKDGLLGELSEKQKKGIESCAGQIGKLKGLIEKLINFVTIEGEGIDYSRETIDLDDFLKKLSTESESWYPEKNATVRVDLDPKIRTISFNRKYLRMLVGQLIDNGLKFNMSDPALVGVHCSIDKNDIVIRVSDNGIGIPPEYQEKIFEKFFQIEKYYTGNIEGVGLGLAHVKNITEAFKGTVAVESTSGQGSTFTVRIPVV